MPVVGISSRKQRQDLGNDGIAPAPVRPGVEIVHNLTLISVDGDNLPKEVRNQETHPEIIQEIWGVSFKSGSIEVAILPISFQRLTNAKKKAIQWIFVVLFHLFHS